MAVVAVTGSWVLVGPVGVVGATVTGAALVDVLDVVDGGRLSAGVDGPGTIDTPAVAVGRPVDGVKDLVES